jgi:O-acetyl-ADP-ribose deacetylase (regulator of RNase III)
MPISEKLCCVQVTGLLAPCQSDSLRVLSNHLEVPKSKQPMANTKLTYITGNIFDAPPNTILIHACNTLGSWGAGIALAFQSKYPDAFKVYKAHCAAHTNDELIGTCLVIRGKPVAESGKGHDIACLFTSRAYGRYKDGPEDILNATRGAVRDLLRQNGEGKPLHAW